MASTNYDASMTDHSQILVSVECTGNVNAESVRYITRSLETHRAVVINDAGCTINVNFSRDASQANSSWAGLQAHRQVYGLIFVAEAASPMESALIVDKYNKMKEGYGAGLYQSRCIIFGIDTAIRSSHSNVFQFSSHDAWKSIDYDIKQFIVSIYYELETKRHKLLQERQGKPILILAPFEVPEEKTVETDSKLFRRKCLGRHVKHLGDIHLLLGLIPESLQYYNSALDILLSAGDSIWVGAALEGLCVVSAMILFNDRGLGKDLLTPEDTKNTYALDPRNLSTKPISGISWADVKKFCIPSFKELVEKYRESIINYSKLKTVAIIELEACIKATKIFSRAKKFLEASEFIQNAVYISLSISGSDRLKRYSKMGDLYKNIKFKRKSFFYKRVAAMQCVSPQLENPDWTLCSTLLMEAIMSLASDSKSFPNDLNSNSWPSVVQRVWRELIFALERDGNRPLSILHLLHVFLSMFPFMSETEEREIHASLESFAKSGKDVQIQKDTFQFELDFYKCPIVKAVLPQVDDDGYRPIKSNKADDQQSVFIYTPASYKVKEKNTQKINFDWCVDTPCRIDVEVHNPLNHCPFQVQEFAFINESSVDAPFETPLFSFSVPPQVTSKVTVSLTPLKPGLIKIIGYKFKIFGVQAECLFADSKHIQTSEIAINVISGLPFVKCDFTGIQSDYHENDIPEIVAYIGETLQLPFKLTNTGSCLIANWDVTCKTKLSDEIKLTFERDFGKMNLLPGTSVALPVKIEPKVNCKVTKAPFSCTLVLKYSADLKWWRSLEVEVNFVFEPSIEVTDLTVLPSEDFSNPKCDLRVTISSHFTDCAKVFWHDCEDLNASSSNATIPAKCIYSCDIAVGKMDLPENVENIHDLRDILASYIEKELDVTWEMKSGRRVHHSGVARYKFSMKNQDISKMVNVPIVCSLSKDSTVDEGVNNVCPLAEVIRFGFDLYNNSTAKQPFNISLEVYQDQQNGYLERNLEECVLCLGCTNASVDVSPGELFEFPCEILLLKEGTYCIRAVYTIILSEKSGASSGTIQCYSSSVTITSES